MADNKSEICNDERAFLHDLGTPLGSATLLTDSLLEDFRLRAGSDPDDLMRLTSLCQALQQITELIKIRRNVLISRGVPSARNQ